VTTLRSNSFPSLLSTAALGLSLSLLSALPAMAHGSAGSAAGLLHPLLGLDHLLLLLGVGLAANRYGRGVLLAAVIGAVIGAILGTTGTLLPGAELLAALAVSGVGLSLLQANQLVPAAVAAGLTIHGLLHGLESQGTVAWWLGSLMSSAVVVGAGLLIARQLNLRQQQVVAGALALSGGLLALAPL